MARQLRMARPNLDGLPQVRFQRGMNSAPTERGRCTLGKRDQRLVWW